jgi:AcrR family transcriptional regulator
MGRMADPKAKVADVARQLGVTTTTFYVYLNGDGTLKAPGKALLDETGRTRRLIESHG